MKIVSAMSANMIRVETGSFSLDFQKISPADVPANLEPAIGHKDTATLVESMIGQINLFGRQDIQLFPGDSVVLAQYRGPRLPEGATVLPEGAKIEFYVVSVLLSCPTIQDIIALAALLPSGLQDRKAWEKLGAEREELLDALGEGDEIGALTELADAVYYAAKHIEYCASLCGVDVDDAMEIARTKYKMRATPGNAKDDAAERNAVRLYIEK